MKDRSLTHKDEEKPLWKELSAPFAKMERLLAKFFLKLTSLKD
jgi:hypothetical protein